MTPKLYEVGTPIHCRKCGHDWRLKMAKRPNFCPRCKNPNWDDGPKEDGMGRPAKTKVS